MAESLLSTMLREEPKYIGLLFLAALSDCKPSFGGATGNVGP
ncbi:hypothetical protein [Halomarina oriensis]|nr:hypothetical protein [Halomarina oriensis]